VGIGAVVAVAGAEFLHWRASRQEFGRVSASGSEAVLVLGYPARRDGRPHPLQRWRCEIAVRSMDLRRDGTIVFSGARTGSGWVEAQVMADYARRVLGVPAQRILLETEAHNTWQNIEFSIPMIERADIIKIVSDPMHAARARGYLRAQRPDLADRLAATADYRFLDHWWLKVPQAGYELGEKFLR